MERRLAAILAADVVGYSRLMGVSEERTLAALKAHRDTLIDGEISARRGRIVKTSGDGVLVEFPSVVAAVECAVAIQHGMADRNRDVPLDQRIEFRIGINLDEVIIDGDDILGDGVNIAARLEGVAEPGTICISGAVYGHVQNRVDFSCEDLGDQRFKNIAGPVRVYRIRPTLSHVAPQVAVYAGELLPLPEKPSIAILPFTALTGDQQQDYFAEGLRLDIQAALVHASGLFLIAPATVNTYRDVPAQQAAREMGVRYILEGALRRSGQRVRVSVELTDCVARQVVWAEQFDRVLEDDFGVQDEITAEVLKALDVKLASGEKWLLHSAFSKLETLDLFYRGLSHFYAGTKNDNAAARAMFESIVRLQPGSSIGLAYLCFTHWVDVFRGWADSRDQSLAQAMKLAHDAINFKGASNGLAHLALAFMHLLNRRHDEALTKCYEAVALRPNCPTACSYLAHILHYCGRPGEAIAKIKQAIRTTPVFPAWYMSLLAAAYRDNGELSNSIAAAQHGIRLNPADCDARLVLCSDYVLAGQRQEAQRVGQEIVGLDAAFSIARYAESQPYKDGDRLRRLLDTFREAGLPD
jgi:class 3 adenylate cyclase/TolB-like protein